MLVGNGKKAVAFTRALAIVTPVCMQFISFCAYSHKLYSLTHVSDEQCLKVNLVLAVSAAALTLKICKVVWCTDVLEREKYHFRTFSHILCLLLVLRFPLNEQIKTRVYAK